MFSVKKILSILTAVSIMFSLCACGGTENTNVNSNNNSNTETEEENTYYIKGVNNSKNVFLSKIIVK